MAYLKKDPAEVHAEAMGDLLNTAAVWLTTGRIRGRKHNTLYSKIAEQLEADSIKIYAPVFWADGDNFKCLVVLRFEDSGVPSKDPQAQLLNLNSRGIISSEEE